MRHSGSTIVLQSIFDASVEYRHKVINSLCISSRDGKETWETQSFLHRVSASAQMLPSLVLFPCVSATFWNQQSGLHKSIDVFRSFLPGALGLHIVLKPYKRHGLRHLSQLAHLILNPWDLVYHHSIAPASSLKEPDLEQSRLPGAANCRKYSEVLDWFCLCMI